MIPIVGWLLVAGLGLMAASCRREQEAPPEDKKMKTPPNCPGGEAPIEVEADGTQVQLCHQEPKAAADGIYQKSTDALALKIDDRFIPSSDPQFQSYQEKFHLPDFQGLPLRLWAAESRELFPSKTQGVGRKDLASILRFCAEKNLDFAEVKRIAAQIGPFAAKTTAPRPSPDMTPEEKMQALAIVSSLMALQKEGHGFYGKNREFVDTVLKIIEAGKLKIRNWIGTKVQVGNGITDFIVYNFQENGMEIASHLDPNDEKAFTSMIHELYHLY